MTTPAGTYDTGTVSITTNTTSLVGVGTSWSLTILEGDWFYAVGLVGMVDTVVDDTHITLRMPWAGSTLVAAAYFIEKMAIQRYQSAAVFEKVTDLVAIMDAAAVYVVTGSTPDNGIGEDGQTALKLNAGPWKSWVKVTGVWVLQPSVVGVATADIYANRPTSPVEGMLFAFTDSNTNTWGAVIADSGTNHVLGYFNGTAWTVAAK